MTRSADSSANRLLVFLWLLEGCALLIALALYKKGPRPLSLFVTTPTGVALLVAASALIALAPLIVRLVRESRERSAAIVVLNLGSLVLAGIGAEAVIRVFSVATPDGRMFANTVLLPRSWEKVAAWNRAALAKASVQGSFLIADDHLGWRIAPNRSSKDYNLDYVREFFSERGGRCAAAVRNAVLRDGAPQNDVYQSSAEGLRSPRAGIAFEQIPARRRIALVGDSFTFGLEVRYEQTWGHQLERILGDGTQVLNFGVDGYGVDQAYLRYRRDVIGWNPDLVILGMIDDDLRRTMCVYGFLCFPGSAIPFAKPRFVSDGNNPELVNVPLPDPDTLFAKTSIWDLPYVDLDPGFGQRLDWEERFYHKSYAIRFLVSRFPRWPEPAPGLTDEAMRSLNAQIVRSFLDDAREHGSKAMVAYFPSHVPECMPDAAASWSPARQSLEQAQIPFLDLTGCLAALQPGERFHALHYSPAANAAVARCLAEAIRGPANGS